MKTKVQANDPEKLPAASAKTLAEFISKSQPGDRSTYTIEELSDLSRVKTSDWDHRLIG